MEKMEIKILFDSEGIDSEFSIGWGLSVLIDGKILFDTGERGDFLITNLEKMSIDIENIDAVVISHDHWDHTGGLWEILKRRKGIKVYALPNFGKEFKEKVKNLEGRLLENKIFSEIAKDIFVTGEISGTYDGRYIPEQAVVLKTARGLTVITGCAHPGILKILETIKEEFPEDGFYLVFGGFHLKNNDKRLINIIVERFKEMNIQNVGPTHCTGKEEEALFRKKYKDNCISIKAGQVIEV
jgi:7,8-dihydropterin-6-yl-methyl-4-(beta-D-ribofuranosyl)aminobenzene 5'-phosphate synthase